MIRAERLAATIDCEFVVFLIGMRINKPLRLRKRIPVASAMPRMIRELYRRPELLGRVRPLPWANRPRPG
jgi:hypothetical protein